MSPAAESRDKPLQPETPSKLALALSNSGWSTCVFVASATYDLAYGYVQPKFGLELTSIFSFRLFFKESAFFNLKL